MDTAFLQARITALEAQIEAYETAILAVTSGKVQSFSLDTGQTKETVTKKNVASYQNSLEKALNMLAVYEARLNGAAIQPRPAW